MNKPLPVRRSNQRVARRAPEVARQEILDAAALFLETRPFGELNIGRLMEMTQIGRSAFYVYFPDIESLVQALLDEVVSEVRSYNAEWRQAESYYDDAMDAALTNIINLWMRRGAMFKAVFDASATYPSLAKALDGVMQAYEIDVKRLLERERAATGIVRDTDIEVAPFLVRACQAYLRSRVGSDGCADPLMVQRTLRAMWQRILFPQHFMPVKTN